MMVAGIVRVRVYANYAKKFQNIVSSQRVCNGDWFFQCSSLIQRVVFPRASRANLGKHANLLKTQLKIIGGASVSRCSVISALLETL